MKISKNNYIQLKTRKEILKYKNSDGSYEDTTKCGWMNNIEEVFGLKIKVTNTSKIGNYYIEKLHVYISPDWCNDTKHISFKSILANN